MKIIAIDGPSGSGKGTIAKEVAKRLGYTYVDTGAMYRCVSLMSLREGLEEKDEDKIVDLLKNMDIRLTNDGKVFLDGEDVSDEVKEQCVIMTKYEGYIEKQLKQIDQFKKLENKKLPEVIDYLSIDGLRIEARQKLDAIRPISIGQASRISGVSPADISVLMIYLESRK